MTIVRNDANVEDLVQLTFLKAHLARDRFELRGGPPDGAVLAWYFAIGRNLALDFLRSQGRNSKRQAPGRSNEQIKRVADSAPSIEDRAVRQDLDAEIIEQVHGALALLPASQREVVEMHKLRGYSMAEVASRLQISEGAARVRAHRGYRALARLLTRSIIVSLWVLTLGASPLSRWIGQ